MSKPRMKTITYKDGSKLFRQGIDNEEYDVNLLYNEPSNHITQWKIKLSDYDKLYITAHELACLKKILNSKKVSKLLEGF